MDKELKEWINKSLNETISDEEARARRAFAPGL